MDEWLKRLLNLDLASNLANKAPHSKLRYIPWLLLYVITYQRVTPDYPLQAVASKAGVQVLNNSATSQEVCFGQGTPLESLIFAALNCWDQNSIRLGRH